MVADPSATLILVDGSSYLYRAYHALPNLTGPANQPTGAIYGVINMMRRLIDEWHPERIAVVFDAPGRTFRDDWYDQYKANRPSMSGDLVEQIAPIHEMIRALGFPVIVIPGVEADDVIGTLTRRAGEAGLKTVISTGDKDMAQLVTDAVELINTMTGERLDPGGVKAKFGVPPERIIDLLTLVGDTSDNVPGVSKVGPKTAVKWLTEWGTLDAIVAHSDQIGGKVGENLRSALDQLPLSRRLVTIRVDLDESDGLAIDLQELQRGKPDYAVLSALCRQYGFRTWLKEYEQALSAGTLPVGAGTFSAGRTGDLAGVLTGDLAGNLVGNLPGSRPANANEPAPRVTVVLDWKTFDEWLVRLSAAEWFAFDTETTSLDPLEARLVGFSFALEADEGIYIPLGHSGMDQPAQLSCTTVLERLRPVFENPSIGKLCHHAKYDQHVLLNAGIALQGVRYDTMLESYVLNSTASRHSLDALALMRLQHNMITYEDVTGKGANQIPFSDVPIERAAAYAAEDAYMTFRLHHVLYPELQASPRLLSVYEAIEVPLIPVLNRIERHGVGIDTAMLKSQGEAIDVRLGEIEARAYEEAGEVFNLQSPQQLQTILFEKMKLRVIEKTPKGAPSTSETVLQELALDYILPGIILEHRTLSKLKSTYLDKLPAQVNAATGRVHTSYHQANTATGRLSSSNPNLQNIPVRTAEGRMIRQAFVAEPGHRLVALDYSQIELRIMADLSRDAGLMDAFANDLDVHRVTAAEVFGSPLEYVSSEQRRAAKAINFGLIYGMSAFGLARQLSIPRAAAQEYINLYFQRYPGVKRYMDDIVQQARAQGYVETRFGRRLYLPEIKARNANRRQYAERTAINAPMQGTAADIIKRAMIEIDTFLQAHADWRVRMIMQVHDELVFEVPVERVDDLIHVARSKMESAAALAVPLKVDAGSGINWDEAH